MAYFPDKQKIKQEIQENVNQFDLSCNHLTTANFFEPNVAYIRDNTTRETFNNDTGVFARPLPMQLPVMGSAELKLKTFFVPYRTLSLQWNNFITRSPHVPANAIAPIIVQEMPYFKMSTMCAFFTQATCATVTTGNIWDFKTTNGVTYILTAYGRHCMKILNQLRYRLIYDDKGGSNNEKHINALRLLAFAKVYMDYYYSSQYAYITAASYEVESIFKADGNTAYELKLNDLNNIFEVTRYSFYTEDYFVSQWDNATSPNQVNSSFGTLQMWDITMQGTNVLSPLVEIKSEGSNNAEGTPTLYPGANGNSNSVITQYALDSLKACTDYVRRYAMAGVRSIDRYLSRFGVLLTAEKLLRSEFYGTQTTPMEFGSVMSTAETATANVGDYAGQGIINSDMKEHTHFELEDMKDLGCIIQIFTINPKIGYFQGIARENLRTDPESYFNGQFDSLGTQATSAAELYLSNDATSPFGQQAQIDSIFGYMPRQAHMKLALDNLTGDFTLPSMNNGTLQSPWHMFRVFDDTYFNSLGGVVHTPVFVQAYDAEQYLRIFNATTNEAGDHIIVLLQAKVTANMHAKPIYDTYDFEGEGKQIVIDGLGPKAN